MSQCTEQIFTKGESWNEGEWFSDTIWLCEALEYAADKGYVIKLNEASDRYLALAEKAEIKFLH